MAQHARPVGPTTNAAAGFSPEMAAGSGPHRPRLPFMAQVGTSVSQTTHVAAPFTPSMSAGAQPALPVRILPFTPGSFVAPPDIPLFSIEMIRGARPDRSRELLGAKIPLPLINPTFTVNFGPEQVAGDHRPVSNRAFVPPKTGWSDSQLTFAVAMTPEMFAGSAPDRNRQLLASKIPLPVAQPTPVAAPFSQEMAIGSRPDQPRPPFQVRVGWAVAQPTFDVQMTPEMFAGSLPDRPRPFQAPRLPLPDSQLSPVSAPFGVEMVLGWHPDRPCIYFPLRVDLPLTVQIAVIAMVASADIIVQCFADDIVVVPFPDDEVTTT